MKTRECRGKLTDFRPGPYQSRRDFRPDRLLELACSIRDQGLISPPLVAQNGSGYHIIAGERRWRAVCANALLDCQVFASLQAAARRVAAPDGAAFIARCPQLARTTMPARLAVEATPQQLHVAAVVDNGQRADLNPIEEALDFQRLMDRYGWSVMQTAKKVGKSYPHVRSRLTWLRLEAEIQQLVATGQLPRSRRAAEALLAVPDAGTRLQLARRFATRRTSIAAIEAACTRVVAELERDEPENKTTAPVPISQALLIQDSPSAPYSPPPSRLCLCPGCREVIANLSEELCNQCSAHGPAATCRDCPAVIEFINRLVSLC